MMTQIQSLFVIHHIHFIPERSTRFFMIKICDVMWMCMLVPVCTEICVPMYVYPENSVYDIIFNYGNWSKEQNTNCNQTGIFSFSETRTLIKEIQRD